MRVPVWFLLVLTGKEDACSHYILSRGQNALLSLCRCCNLHHGGYRLWPHGVGPITEVFTLRLLLFSLFGQFLRRPPCSFPFISFLLPSPFNLSSSFSFASVESPSSLTSLRHDCGIRSQQLRQGKMERKRYCSVAIIERSLIFPKSKCYIVVDQDCRVWNSMLRLLPVVLQVQELLSRKCSPCKAPKWKLRIAGSFQKDGDTGHKCEQWVMRQEE